MPKHTPRSCLRRSFFFLLISAAALAIAPPVSAHETWILAGSARIPVPGVVPVVLTSGMVFPRPVTSVRPERLEKSGIRIGNEDSGTLKPRAEMGSTLLATAELGRPGIARVWLKLPALPVELTPELVDVYLDEIQANPEVRRAWASRKTNSWREHYEKFAKTILRVGDPGSVDRSWAEPIGGALEIVPESDPTALVPGAPFTVRVLKYGRPLAGLMLAAQESGRRDWQRTDRRGRATFQLAGSGPWLIHGTQLVRAHFPDAEWQSWFTTLTIPRQGLALR